MVGQILSQIPVWVDAVFVYGVFMGIRAMFARNVSLAVMTILPLVFLGLSLTSLIAGIKGVPVSGPFWAAGLVIGLIFGMTILSANILDPAVAPGRLRLAGSPVPLILFILIFTTKFYYNVHIAMDPSVATHTAFVSTVLALSGASTGIMIGRISKLYISYFKHRTCVAAE